MQESNSVRNANKFNPQPGDKIICNNDEEFICCTLDFLNTEGIATYLSNEYIFAYREAKDNHYFGYDWQYWEKDGTIYEEDYNIREVISAKSEGVVKEKETRYTVEDIKCAFSHLEWSGVSLSLLLNELQRVNNPEYQEYLRLKAIYERRLEKESQ